MSKYTKFSYGLICVNTFEEPKILLIKKRHTYAYIDFVNGNYRISDDSLRYLFNHMTVQEKLNVKKFDYNMLWYDVTGVDEGLKARAQRLTFMQRNTLFRTANTELENEEKLLKRYISGLAKFKNAIRPIEKINHIISSSNSVELYWELPKGRKDNDNETDLDCAIREFKEETSIWKTAYNLMPQLGTLIEQINTTNVQYVSKYFFAHYANPRYFPNIHVNDLVQVREISGITWLPKSALPYFYMSDSTREICAVAFKKYKNGCKKKQLIKI